MLRSIVKHNPRKPKKSALKNNQCILISDFSPQGQEWLKKLLVDMKDTCVAMRGVGLAANQIGVFRQVILIMEPKKLPIIMINPKIIEAYGDELGEDEGCLSVPGERGIVKRKQYVVVEFQESDGTPRTAVCCDYEARIVQHEVDHINNIVCCDRFEEKK